jgi:hypothetical protein
MKSKEKMVYYKQMINCGQQKRQQQFITKRWIAQDANASKLSFKTIGWSS